MEQFYLYQIDPFQVDTDRDPFAKKDYDLATNSWIDFLDGGLPVVFDVGMTIITIFFVISVCAMAISIVFKNGQWTKWSTGVMTFTLIIVLFFRGGITLLFSVDGLGFAYIVNDALSFVKKLGIYAAIIMLLVGLLMRYNYVLINHPDYHRWSKRLMVGSVLIAVLATVMPAVILGV